MVIKSSEVKLFVHVPYALVPDSDSSYTSGHKSATDVIPTMENKGEHQINNRERRMNKNNNNTRFNWTRGNCKKVPEQKNEANLQQQQQQQKLI